MGARFRHSVGDLEADFLASSRGFKAPASRAVQQTARTGYGTARRLSKSLSGDHGKRFYKRITLERITPLEYEYGPEGVPKSEFVGVGYRSGSGGMEMAQSSDGLLNELERRLQIAREGSWRVT